MPTLEVELSYLAALIPPDLENCEHKDLFDMYFPANIEHPKLRIRQKGDSYELTKKTQTNSNDAGVQHEENIELTADEFAALAKSDGRKLVKKRYRMPYKGLVAEIDIFTGPLKGLVVIEFEFKTLEEKSDFVKPDFCLADVTQENFIAGGFLAGKSYSDISFYLARFGYIAL
jgi:CYTH domain-containing protein